MAAARATINDERFKVSLRIPKSDLTRLKSRALQEGIPYQTLINSIIHKYVLAIPLDVHSLKLHVLVVI